MVRSERQLLNFVKFSPIIFITLIAILVNVLTYLQNKKNFEKDLQIYKENYISTNKAIIKSQVDKIYSHILKEQKRHIKNLEKDLESKISLAYNTVENIHKKFKNKSKKEIYKIIKESLRNYRFNNGRGYFYIYEMSGLNILHPIHQEFEGKYLLDLKDKKGHKEIKKIIQTLKTNDDCFTNFYWSKPNSPNKIYKKISYNKIYKPLNIFIGTGEYVDNYIKNLKNYLINEYIQNVSFGKNGYILVFDYEGKQLAHYKKSYIGKNRINLTDKNGFNITKKIIQTAKYGSGFINYIATVMPQTGKPARKISYVKGMNTWQWAIAAGFYEKDLNDYLEIKRSELKRLNEKYLKKIAIITIILSIALYIIAFYIESTLKKSFKEYKQKIKDKMEENRRKDLLLNQQSKMASMGEMLGNIAHQWRQPLSTISTIASGTKIQKELNMLDDKQFNDGMETIVETTKYLSQTIDDFRGFFNPEKIKNQFTTTHIYNKVIKILSARLSNYNIRIVENIDILKIESYENELAQALINVINNAVDAFEDKDIEDRNITIEMVLASKRAKLITKGKMNESSNDFIYISIKDNAGGISNAVIDKIFDVYFTTKHQKQGTGIGLYMTYEILTKHLGGFISVENITHKNGEKGAKFSILLPLK